MRSHFKTILVLCLSGLCLACTKEIPYKQDNFEPIVVLNSIWQEGQPLNLNLSSSIGILDDTAQVVIDEALVSIKSEGKELNVQNTGKGVYRSLAICEAGKSYEIRVEAPGFETVVASETAPKILEATLPDSTAQLVNNELIDVVIKDGAEDNFYLVEVKAKRYAIVLDPVTLQLDSSLVLESIPFENLNKIFISDLEIVSKNTDFELFDDRLFNGKEYILQLEIPLSESRRSATHSAPEYYMVSLKSISKSYYDFLRNFLVSRPIYGGPFESYRQIPTNVQGGAGLMGMYSQVSDTVFIAE